MLPNWINMLSWWQWAVLAAIPPAIVALYFLKLKRTPLEVPSTYLWHKSIEDLHVNSIWQRLRKNLLLFLQLLLIGLVMLAVLRPSWQSGSLSGDRFIFLIDHSASMSATDVQPSRLAEAKRQVLALVDRMKSGDRAMVISFAETAQVVQEFTDNRRQLRERVESIRPAHGTTSLAPALRLAAGLANPGSTATDATDIQVAEALPAELMIFSDGRFGPVDGFALGNLRPTYVPIGDPQATNLAITAFSTRRQETGQRQVYGQLQNDGPKPVAAEVELYVDGQLDNADAVEIAPGEAEGLIFPLPEMSDGVVRLNLSTSDALALDNQAYATVNQARRGQVLVVTPGNEALRLALRTTAASQVADVELVEPAYLESEAYQAQATAGHLDLIIFDQCAPQETMPAANTLLLGRLPGERWGEVRKKSTPGIIDVDRAHPLLQLVDLTNIDIAESMVLAPPAGSTTLVESDAGPLVAIGPRDGFEDLVVGFEIYGQSDTGERYVNTNWPLRASFPTFVLGVLQYFCGQAEFDAIRSVKPGQPVRLTGVAEAKRLEVVGPDGARDRVSRGKNHRFTFTATGQIGVYTVYHGPQITERFAVNLFDRTESNLATRPEQAIQIGYVEVAGKTDWEPTRRETWKLLVLLALGVLVLEWYIYNRRVYI